MQTEIFLAIIGVIFNLMHCISRCHEVRYLTSIIRGSSIGYFLYIVPHKMTKILENVRFELNAKNNEYVSRKLGRIENSPDEPSVRANLKVEGIKFGRIYCQCRLTFYAYTNYCHFGSGAAKSRRIKSGSDSNLPTKCTEFCTGCLTKLSWVDGKCRRTCKSLPSLKLHKNARMR